MENYNFKGYYDRKGNPILYDPVHDEYFCTKTGLVIRRNNIDLIEGVDFG